MNGYREATRIDAEEFAEGLSKAHLTCRSYGHNPYPQKVRVVTTEGSRRQYYEQTLKCRNDCGVIWRLLINMTTGRQVARRADYTRAKGYLARGIGRITADGKGAIRLKAITDHYFTEESE